MNEQKTEGTGRRPQPAPVRIAHWINVPALAVMAASGLEIFTAYPKLGPRDHPYRWFPLQGWDPPALLRTGGWLAGARHVHFALAWLLVGNALVYLGYLSLSGEWRRRTFLPRRDASGLLETLGAYARLRNPPPRGLYNGLQRFAYTSALALGLIELLSGLAIYKPVQLWPVTALFGGFEAARAVHFLGLAALVFFTSGHLAMVLLHPRSLWEMVAGGRRG
ncbi:MAG: cytochrome b/b6 domain-containing protein [Deltaproteobacteria bacterium]